MQNAAMEWGDLRHFLAVAKSGSTLGAAKLLGVNQTTVARRVAALEEALQERLFDRASGGYKLTDLGVAMVEQAERVSAEVDAFNRLIAQRSPRRAGRIRVTTSDIVASVLVTPWLGEYAARFPNVQVEIIIDDRRYDLSRGEADIAIRASNVRPEGEGLVVRNLGSWGMWGIYAGRSYVAAHGKPYTVEDLPKHRIVGVAGPLASHEPEFWKQAQALGARAHSASSSISSIAASVRSGVGIGPLPCMLGELDPEMELCFIVDEMKFQLMLITREEIRNAPHVRAFNDFVVARTSALRHIIEGPRPSRDAGSTRLT
jgi:DNA-binding transcriptional LysR family regulator